jgi:hypothetical protein
MDVKSAAAAVGVNPKRLRAFLRSNAAKYCPPGAGGRYDLSSFTADELRSDYEAWRSAFTPRIARTDTLADDCDDDTGDDDTLPLGAPRDAVRAQARARVERLEQLLRAKGLHLAQMTEHPSWARATQPRTSTRKHQR